MIDLLVCVCVFVIFMQFPFPKCPPISFLSTQNDVFQILAGPTFLSHSGFGTDFLDIFHKTWGVTPPPLNVRPCHPILPCQLFLWEETGAPGENPQISAPKIGCADVWPTNTWPTDTRPIEMFDQQDRHFVGGLLADKTLGRQENSLTFQLFETTS